MIRLSLLLLTTANPGAGAWFDGLGPPIVASTEEWHALGAAAAALAAGDPLPSPPAVFERDKGGRIALLSVSSGARAQVFLGEGGGVWAAVRSAAAGLRAPRGAWTRLDVVVRARLVDASGGRLPPDFDRTLEGLASIRAGGPALLPDQLMAGGLVTEGNIVELGGPFHPPQLFAFTTKALFASPEGVVEIYRGHRPFERLRVEDARAALSLAAHYLAASVDEVGRYEYLYDPVIGRVSDRYHSIRHAGCTWAVAEAYRDTRDPRLLAAARRALAWLLRQARPCPQGGGLCIVEGGRVALGANALAILALVEHLESAPRPPKASADARERGVLDADWRRKALLLGEWLLESQDSRGDFAHRVEFPGGRVLPRRSDYFSGEAVLALLRLHRLDGDERWLDAAVRGAGFLIEVRDRDKPLESLLHDHWLLYALNELHRARPQESTLRHALRIAEAILLRQNRGADPPDWRGGWGRPPRSTPAATRSEGLCAAYELTRDFGSPVEAARILDSIELALAFQLRTQFAPESAMYLRDPRRVLGAFRRALDSLEVRNDYTQHNVASLLCWLRNRPAAALP